MASTYPLEVVEADRWAKQNKNQKGDAFAAALEKQTWDPSVKSLTNFPQVLSMMSEKLELTQKLGDVFLAQQKDVLDAVQRLRAKAEQSGNLKTTTEQKVIVEEKIIKIEPANPQVVYVPTYNPTVVYGAWPYPAYPPYSWYPPGYVATAAFHSPPASQSAPRGATPGAVVIGVVAMSTSILIATSISTTRISIAKIIRRIFRHAALTQAASGSMTRAIERVSPTEITRLPRSLTEGRTPKLLRCANHFAEGRRAVARIWLGAEPAG
jgi:hypothetical protein